MKPQRAPLEIFSLSFLDIVACAFGAVVMLVLISKPEPEPVDVVMGNAPVAVVETLQAELARLEQQKRSKETELAALSDETARLQKRFSAAEQDQAALDSTIAALEGQRRGLTESVREREQATIRTTSRAPVRDEEVGGIPVDSDYVIFIVDTSGSMQSVWERVAREMVNVLSIHPQVKGFQVLNDNGHHLLEGYRGRWITDTPGTRRQVQDLFRNWRKASSSRPVEGLETALELYTDPDRSLSIYIFGDEYAGTNFERDIDYITSLNTDPNTGKLLSRIHGLAFNNRHADSEYLTLMRELARRNNGTVIALPD